MNGSRGIRFLFSCMEDNGGEPGRTSTEMHRLEGLPFRTGVTMIEWTAE